MNSTDGTYIVFIKLTKIGYQTATLTDDEMPDCLAGLCEDIAHALKENFDKYRSNDEYNGNTTLTAMVMDNEVVFYYAFHEFENGKRMELSLPEEHE